MRTCPACGDLNPLTANYCHGCGALQIPRDSVPAKWRSGYGRNRHCVYCGRACHGVRCADHADLPLPVSA